MKVKIIFNDEEVLAELNDSHTSKEIQKMLPVEGQANIWGNEIYFDVNLFLDESKDASDEVEIGEMAYWPPGNKLCIFFGRTPISVTDKPKAAGPVNVFGKIYGDDAIAKLKKVQQGTKITIKKL